MMGPGMMGPGTMSGGMMQPGGMGGGMTGVLGGPAAGAAAKSEPALPEKLQKFLQSRVDLDFNEQPFNDVLDYLQNEVGGDISFVDRNAAGGQAVTLHLKQVTIEAALQAIADLTDQCFILRDYGILVANCNMANPYLDGGIPMIAPGMPALQSGGSKPAK
jgi:hypothetical protein